MPLCNEQTRVGCRCSRDESPVRDHCEFVTAGRDMPGQAVLNGKLRQLRKTEVCALLGMQYGCLAEGTPDSANHMHKTAEMHHSQFIRRDRTEYGMNEHE